jgi:hypothetical protein
LRARGQTTSLEFFVVSGVVALAITASFYVYSLTSARTSDAHGRIAIETYSIDIVDGLIKTSGSPGDWERNASLTTSFGLADSPLKLDRRKVDALAGFDYDQARRIMGIESYNYFFSVERPDGTVVNQSGVRPTNAKVATNPRATAVLDGNAVYVDLVVWR